MPPAALNPAISGAGGRHRFIAGLPKAELHLHIEGTLEPGLKHDLARRNNQTAPAAAEAYDFTDLTSFLVAYYEAMSVLRTEQDFYDLAMAYFRKAAEQRIVYAEVFFDPQAHTARGVAFDHVIDGLHRARNDAARELGVRAQLIMCFLRDRPAAEALRTLEQAAPHRDKIVGVGLDSDERDNPPVKFREVFARARDQGYRLTMHADVDQRDSVAHIWQCLDVIGVARVDHGVNCLEDDALVARLANDGIGLTVCPISNGWVTSSRKTAELAAMLRNGLKVTVNSDDPAYFGGYLNENLAVAAEEAALSNAQLIQLTRNAFEIAWLPPADRDAYLAELDGYATQNSLPSGSRITVYVPRTSAVRRSTVPPAASSRATCAATSAARSDPATAGSTRRPKGSVAPEPPSKERRGPRILRPVRARGGTWPPNPPSESPFQNRVDCCRDYMYVVVTTTDT